MAKIITIPNDDDVILNADRDRIADWALTTGGEWVYVAYDNESDHIAQIETEAGGAPLKILDFDCHGNPSRFNHTDTNTAFQFGQKLSQLPGFSPTTEIYLSACNTGLGLVAQYVADGAGCPVFGSCGSLEGTFAQGNEECSAGPYGGYSAVGRGVWIPFKRKEREMTQQATSFNLRVGKQETELAPLLDVLMRTKSVEFPNLRMAPDITISYYSDKRVIILDVYANGGLVKNRITNTAWRVENVRELQTIVRKVMRVYDGKLGPFVLLSE